MKKLRNRFGTYFDAVRNTKLAFVAFKNICLATNHKQNRESDVRLSSDKPLVCAVRSVE